MGMGQASMDKVVMNAPVAKQLTLSVQLRDDATLENFFVGANANLIDCLKQLITVGNDRFIYIWGHPGSGRSHLLQACCHLAGERDLIAMYLPLVDLCDSTAQILEDIESIDLIFIDDLQAIAGNNHWEEALFHLYNRIQESQTRLVITADLAPNHLGIKLPDFSSRLNHGVLFHLQELSEAEKIKAIQMRATRRGMMLADDVAKFLLHRIPRTMSALHESLDKLDEASLVEQRRLTIPFVKEVLDV